MLPNAPFRIRFRVPATLGYNAGTPSYSGMFRIINTQIGYSTNFLCFFRQYTTLTRMLQQTEYVEAKANSYSVSSTTLDIIPPKSMQIDASYYYELIIMPLDINLAGCTAGGCASKSGFQQVNFETINIIAYTNPSVGPSIASQQVQRMYKN